MPKNESNAQSDRAEHMCFFEYHYKLASFQFLIAYIRKSRHYSRWWHIYKRCRVESNNFIFLNIWLYTIGWDYKTNFQKTNKLNLKKVMRLRLFRFTGTIIDDYNYNSYGQHFYCSKIKKIKIIQIIVYPDSDSKKKKKFPSSRNHWLGVCSSNTLNV